MKISSGRKTFMAFVLYVLLLVVMLPAMAYADDPDEIATWVDLQYAFNDAHNGDTVKLTQDLTGKNARYPITLYGTASSSKYITLDLNGHTLDRGLGDEEAKEGGNVIVVESGMLTIKDSSSERTGTITGGNTTGDGGGIYVAGDSRLEIQGGIISGNMAKGNGGGVYSERTVSVMGGTISSNTAKNGGGICFADSEYAYLELFGGTISDNTANSKAGGVMVSPKSEIYVKGSPVVNDNSDPFDTDLYLSSGKLLNVRGAFADGAYLSVWTETAPSTTTPVTITEKYSEYNSGATAGSWIHAENGYLTDMSGGEVVIKPDPDNIYYNHRLCHKLRLH